MPTTSPRFSEGAPSRLSLIVRAQRYWHTVAHLRPEQTLARVRLRSASALRQVAPGTAAAWYRQLASRAALTVAPRGLSAERAAAELTLQDPDVARLERDAQAYLRGDVEYLSTSAAAGRPSQWRHAGHSHLWRYHLQYFDELPELALVAPPADVFALMREWIAAFPCGSDRDAWHPFVVSVRAVNWMLAASVLAGRGLALPDDIADAMRVDALFVRRNLETDVGGNHLLKNLKALAFASAFWSGPRAKRWRAEAVTQWRRELERQLLNDGGHYERAPTYHCHVLGDLLEVIAALRSSGGDVPAFLVDAARRMTAFLDVISHPDDEIALFNDSAFDAAPPPSTLRQFAAAVLDARPTPGMPPRYLVQVVALAGPVRTGSEAPVQPRSDGDSGFHRLESTDRRLSLIVDVGEPCPPDLPAHAHADLLSFELSVNGERVIVDSGVAEYEQGAWRDYWRSTRAHNTVMIDAVEQTECWGSFRVARRAHPRRVARVHEPGLRAVSASHTGYLRLKPAVEHRRTVALVAERFWVVIDELLGGGRHRWASYLHFHPHVAIEIHDGSLRAVAGRSSLEVAWTEGPEAACVSGELEPIQGWYAPRFGQRQPSATLVLSGESRLPVRFACVLAPHPVQRARIAWRSEQRLAIEIDADGYELSLPKLQLRHLAGVEQ